MDGRHAAVMAGVHRLQHVERLGASRFADDDPVGTHAKSVAHEVARGDLALAFQAGRARLQTHDVGLLQLKLGRILHRDDALAWIDHARHRIHQRGLARARAARDDDIQPGATGDLQDARDLARHGAELDQLRHVDGMAGELADRDIGAVERQRW